MDHGLDDLLVRQDLLGCDGRVSHELVVELDGMVRVRDAHGHVVRVDPRSRAQLPALPRLSVGLIDTACALAREAGAR
jgi:hypothetical protein